MFEFQVIQEIDDMMQETPSSEGDLIEYNEALEKGKEVLSSPLYEDSECPSLFKDNFSFVTIFFVKHRLSLLFILVQRLLFV